MVGEVEVLVRARVEDAARDCREIGRKVLCREGGGDVPPDGLIVLIGHDVPHAGRLACDERGAVIRAALDVQVEPALGLERPAVALLLDLPLQESREVSSAIVMTSQQRDG